MSFIIKLQHLSRQARAADIRDFFTGLSIPSGSVCIVGGDSGEAFIGFETDEDARLAMQRNGGVLCQNRVELSLSSRKEMSQAMDRAKQLNSLLHHVGQRPAADKPVESAPISLPAASGASKASASWKTTAEAANSVVEALGKTDPNWSSFLEQALQRIEKAKETPLDKLGSALAPPNSTTSVLGLGTHADQQTTPPVKHCIEQLPSPADDTQDVSYRAHTQPSYHSYQAQSQHPPYHDSGFKPDTYEHNRYDSRPLIANGLPTGFSSDKSRPYGNFRGNDFDNRYSKPPAMETGRQPEPYKQNDYNDSFSKPPTSASKAQPYNNFQDEGRMTKPPPPSGFNYRSDRSDQGIHAYPNDAKSNTDRNPAYGNRYPHDRSTSFFSYPNKGRDNSMHSNLDDSNATKSYGNNKPVSQNVPQGGFFNRNPDSYRGRPPPSNNQPAQPPKSNDESPNAPQGNMTPDMMETLRLQQMAMANKQTPSVHQFIDPEGLFVELSRLPPQLETHQAIRDFLRPIKPDELRMSYANGVLVHALVKCKCRDDSWDLIGRDGEGEIKIRWTNRSAFDMCEQEHSPFPQAMLNNRAFNLQSDERQSPPTLAGKRRPEKPHDDPPRKSQRTGEMAPTNRRGSWTAAGNEADNNEQQPSTDELGHILLQNVPYKAVEIDVLNYARIARVHNLEVLHLFEHGQVKSDSWLLTVYNSADLKNLKQHRGFILERSVRSYVIPTRIAEEMHHKGLPPKDILVDILRQCHSQPAKPQPHIGPEAKNNANQMAPPPLMGMPPGRQSMFFTGHSIFGGHKFSRNKPQNQISGQMVEAQEDGGVEEASSSSEAQKQPEPLDNKPGADTDAKQREEGCGRAAEESDEPTFSAASFERPAKVIEPAAPPPDSRPPGPARREPAAHLEYRGAYGSQMFGPPRGRGRGQRGHQPRGVRMPGRGHFDYNMPMRPGFY